MPAKKAAAKPKKTRKTKPKVPKAQPRVNVVVLHCHNCGEDEAKVLYCANCDSPMKVEEVQERYEKDINNDDAVAKQKVTEAKTTSRDLENDLGVNSGNVNDLIEQGGLTSIYSEGESSSSSASEGLADDDMNLDDVVSTLDEE